MIASPGPASSLATSLVSSSCVRTTRRSLVAKTEPAKDAGRGPCSGKGEAEDAGWRRFAASRGQLLTNYGRYALAVGATLHFGHDERHDLAHLLGRVGAGLRHGVAHDRVQLLVGE